MTVAVEVKPDEAWIGVVPLRWRVEPLRRWFRDRRTTVSDTDFAPLSVTMQGIVPQLENVAKTDNNANRKLVRAGDFAINSRSDRKGSAGVSEFDGSVSVITTVLEPRGLHPRYTHHLLRSRPFQEEYYRWGHGIVDDLWSTKWSDMKSIKIPVPPAEEQRAIADYLDRETAQIDAFIAKNDELIALLTERRVAIVDNVMASLGFEEPSDLSVTSSTALPAGWRVALLGALLNELTNGFVGPTRDILVEDGVRYIQSTHIKAGQIDFARRPYFVTREWHEHRPRIHLQEGDVLIVQTGDIGKVAVVPAGFGDASCHALQIARVKRKVVLPEFLGAYLSSHFGYSQLKSRATGALHPHLEAGIRRAPVLVPPLPVQAKIVDEARTRGSEIDAMIAQAEALIGLSKERRTALVAAAVTGKIDVGVAA